MSAWTHPICERCWTEREPGRTPHRLVEEYRDQETCCFCGAFTVSGIYYRADPATLPCHAGHDDA